MTRGLCNITTLFLLTRFNFVVWLEKYSSACRYLSWILSCCYVKHFEISWILSCVLCESFWNFINTAMWLDWYDCICIWNQSKNVFYYSQLPFDLFCCSEIFINKNDGKSDLKKMHLRACYLSLFMFVIWLINDINIV